MGLAAGRRRNQPAGRRRRLVEILSRRGIGFAGRSRRTVKPKSSRRRGARPRGPRRRRGGFRGPVRPTLDAAGSYARDRYSANGFPPFPPGMPVEADVYQAGFDAAWELDVFGGTRRAAEAARAEVAAAEFGRRDLLITIFAEVARNYVDARAFQRRLAVAYGQHQGPGGNPGLDARPVRQRT